MPLPAACRSGAAGSHESWTWSSNFKQKRRNITGIRAIAGRWHVARPETAGRDGKSSKARILLAPLKGKRGLAVVVSADFTAKCHSRFFLPNWWRKPGNGCHACVDPCAIAVRVSAKHFPNFQISKTQQQEHRHAVSPRFGTVGWRVSSGLMSGQKVDNVVMSGGVAGNRLTGPRINGPPPPPCHLACCAKAQSETSGAATRRRHWLMKLLTVSRRESVVG
jgi:hypothetical protein